MTAPPNLPLIIVGLILVLISGAGALMLVLKWPQVSELLRSRRAAARQEQNQPREQAEAGLAGLEEALEAARLRASSDAKRYPEQAVQGLAAELAAVEQEAGALKGRLAEAALAARQPAAAMAIYAALPEAAAALAERLTQLDIRRTELDTLNARAATEAARLHEGMHDLERRLDILNPDFPVPAAVLWPLAAYFTRLDTLLVAHRAPELLAMAVEVAAETQRYDEMISAYARRRTAIMQECERQLVIAHHGYHTEAGQAALQQTQELLAEAARAFERGDFVVCSSKLEEVDLACADAALHGSKLPEICRHNEQRIKSLLAYGPKLGRDLAAARQAAACCGNQCLLDPGQAERAARLAFELCQHAALMNTLETQDFSTAAADLDAAEAHMVESCRIIKQLARQSREEMVVGE